MQKFIILANCNNHVGLKRSFNDIIKTSNVRLSDLPGDVSDKSKAEFLFVNDRCGEIDHPELDYFLNGSVNEDCKKGFSDETKNFSILKKFKSLHNFTYLSAFSTLDIYNNTF